MQYHNILFRLACVLGLFVCLIFSSCKAVHKTIVDNSASANESPGKPRVIISSDIGGTDPDDFQSMIHYLMYADKFQTEGLISSPYGPGRKSHILKMIDLYEKDYKLLKAHSDFPSPDQLRQVTKQGAIDGAPLRGWSQPSEGSDWIITCARRGGKQPLWVLVWGGLEDLAQALHDAPDIRDKIHVYFIGGPNKKWTVQAYHYIVTNFPDLWMIESNSTYRGWTLDGNKETGFDNKTFYDTCIRGHGALGNDFGNYYGGMIKMGDSPSVGYLLSGNFEKPEQPGWGGSYMHLEYSARRTYERETTLQDTLPVFGIIEWKIKGPDLGAAIDTPSIWFEIDRQKIDGFYQGNGQYLIRFVPKESKVWNYKIISSVPELNGKTGQFVSMDPWPGSPHRENLGPLHNWWSDRISPGDYAGPHQGANTVYQWRKTYLQDWAKRWQWLAQ